MKKLLLVCAVLCVGSTSMAGSISICDTTVDEIQIKKLDAAIGMGKDITSISNEAAAKGNAVKVCSVGAVPVLITKVFKSDALNPYSPRTDKDVAYMFVQD